MQIEVIGPSALTICKLLDDVGSSAVGSRYKTNHLLWAFITENFPQTCEGNWRIEVAGCTVTLIKIYEEPKKEIVRPLEFEKAKSLIFFIVSIGIVFIVGCYMVKLGGYLRMFL